jgi:hypothetical protein
VFCFFLSQFWIFLGIYEFQIGGGGTNNVYTCKQM